MEDNITRHKYIGYSLEKSQNSIEVLISYVIHSLKTRGFLKEGYELITKNNSEDIDLKTNHSEKNRVIRGNISHEEILKSIYKELLLNDGYLEIDGYSETTNPILPPLFIDDFLMDLVNSEKIEDFWKINRIAEKDNRIFLESLNEVGYEADKYIGDFEYEKALKLFSRLKSASEEILDSEKISAKFILKQIKIYFYLEKYDKCLKIINLYLKKFEYLKLKDEIGELYYYLGMMSVYSNDYEKALNFFSRSS